MTVKKKVKNLTRTHTATSSQDVIIDKNDSIGPYLLTIAEFLSLFGLNATNFRVTIFTSGGAQNASTTYDVYVFKNTGSLVLPAAASMNGQPVIVKNLTTDKIVSITTTSGEFIDLTNTASIENQDSETFVPITGGWIKI